jgi:hypothetical protein
MDFSGTVGKSYAKIIPAFFLSNQAMQFLMRLEDIHSARFGLYVHQQFVFGNAKLLHLE